MWVVGLAENKATQPSLAGAWAELGNNYNNNMIYISKIQVTLKYTDDKICINISIS